MDEWRGSLAMRGDARNRPTDEQVLDARNVTVGEFVQWAGPLTDAVQGLAGRAARVEATLRGMRNELDTIHTHLHGIDRRLDGVERRLSAIDRTLARLAGQLGSGDDG